MRLKTNYRKNRRSTNRLLNRSVQLELERMEDRVLLSTTLAGWTFNNLAIGTNLSPATSTGAGTALSVGFQTSSSNPDSPGGVYAYPNPNASGTGDDSDILVGSGNNGTGDASSEGTPANAWRVRGSSDGWSSNAAIGSQGAQFSTSTVGYSDITVTFDLDASSGSAPDQFQVEYTSDGSTWINATDLTPGTTGNGVTPAPTDGMTVQTNSSNANIVDGSYFAFANNADGLFWQNGIQVDLSGISAVNNDPNFGIRIVNAATGSAELTVGGAAFPTAGSGNWRIDDVQIMAGNGVQTAPTITQNPTNQTVPAGQPVTFTASASGNPTPTVQWFEGAPGSGTPINGQTSDTLTFTTSIDATDNGTTYYAEFTNSQGVQDTTAATLNDALAAPVVTKQPTSVTTTAGSSVTFTAAATGSPLPTVGWQVSSNGGASYAPIVSGQNGYTITNGTLFFGAVASENGYEYEAVFTNSQAPGGVPSNPATLTLGGSLISEWNFVNSGATALVAGQTTIAPAPAIGAGSANSLGMGSAGVYSLYPGDPAAAYTLTVSDSSGAYTTGSIAANATAATIQADLRALNPTTTGGITVTVNPTSSTASAVTLTGDAGATLTGSGSSNFFVSLDDSTLTTAQVTNNPDNSNIIAAADTGNPNSDPNATNAWRIVGENGWNSNAPLGTQGAQFLTATTGFSSIEATFDLYATAQGEAKMQVEYTTDGADWINVPASDLSIPSGDTNISIQNNTNASDTNTVQGGYFDITGGGSSNSWYNGLGVNLSGIAGVNNNPSFGIRIVNASQGADCVNVSGAALNNSSGNDRLADIQITGNNPVAPIITTQPVSQSVLAGATVTFTAAATGFPAPTVQWEVSTNGGLSFVPDTTDAGNTTGTLTIAPATVSESGNEYEAVFTNSLSSTPTTAATLAVNAAPVITMQPASQLATAGSSVTLIAGASGSPAPSVQWEVSTNGGSSFSNITGATLTYLNVTATEGVSGNEYEAVFTNASSSATSNAATITVDGTPIAEWDFATGQAASPGGNTAPGTGNSPLPTTAINPGDSASILGLVNSYDGLQSVPEADIIPLASSVDPSVEDYVWRVRGGGGEGPTGTPGNPDGWSQSAPQDSQGVEFNVNTTGFSNVALNFDWLASGIGDLQPQYFNGSTWVNITTPVQATGGDYYGISAPTTTTAAATLTDDVSATIGVASSSAFYFDENITVGGVPAIVTGVSTGSLTILPTASGSVATKATVAASPDPTGVSISLQGISYADNNPDLQVRLVTVWDPALPNISDGNTGDSFVHGQYASSFGLASDIQVIDLDDYVNSGGGSFNSDGQNFTLTLGTDTTGTIQYNGNPTTMAANIEAALDALPNVGSGNVLVSSTMATNTYTPPGPITSYNGFSVIFQGSLKDTPEPTMTISDSNDNVTTWQNATPSTFATTTTAPYTVTDQVPLTVSVASTANFTVGNPVVLGNITCLITSVGANSLTVTPEGSGSVLAGASVQQLGASGFVDGGGEWELGKINFTGDLTSGGPGITSDPTSESAAAGFPVTFSASAYSESLPTVQWQVSTDGGDSWSNVTGGTVSPTSGIFTLSSNDEYTSTYTFTTDANLDQNGNEYRAVFQNSVSSTDSGAATLTVVAPVTPYVLIQPSDQSVQEGEDSFFTTYGIGSPSPTVQWQISTDGGSVWTNLTDSSTVNGSVTTTLTVATEDNTSQNGDLYRAAFTSSAGTTYSDTVTLTVLPTETVLDDWDFNEEYPNVTSSGSSPDPGVINPAPVASGVDGSVAVAGATATPLGMNLPYNPEDPATGTGAPGAVDDEDIVNSGPAVIDSTFTENTWRIRSGISSNPANGGAPANGWSNFVAAGTQGAQFMVPTTGYTDVYVTLDWFATHSGEQDAQREYTLDGGQTWIDLGPQIQLYAPGNDDFYGDSSITGVVPVVFDLTGVPGAANNPNFGIRLVNSYNLVLSNQQTITLNDTSNFTLEFNGQTTGTITYSPISTTMAANIQAALSALTNVGANNVLVTYNSGNGTYLVQFQGTLGASIQPAMTINTSSGLDTVTQQDQFANAQLNQNGDPFSAVPYNGSKGNWRLDNIVFHGSVIPPYLWTGAADGVSWSNPGNWFGDAVPTSTSNVIIPSGSHVDLPSGVSSAESLTLEGNATLDIGSGTLMIDYGMGADPIASVASSLASGYSGGAWNGTGIISSAVAAENAGQSHLIYSVGYADGADGIVSGLSAGQIEIMPALVGDARLQGNVVFGDFQTLAQYFGQVGGWDEGNFTYGATVDFGDFQELAQDFGATSAFGASEGSGVVAASHGLTPAAPLTEADTADSAAALLGSEYLDGTVSGLVSFSTVPLDLA
ncbi:MAG TPA: immunoglobulin domain-containing protein [Tepidisphaeraceae bacterium]|nr:immunoglobulin domain-containing protein [Tepidisphaeraceae bacterium]